MERSHEGPEPTLQVSGALLPDAVGHVLWRIDHLDTLRAGVFVVRLHIVDDHVHPGHVRAERRRRDDPKLGRYPVQVDDAVSGSKLGVHRLSLPVPRDASLPKAEGTHQPVVCRRDVLVDDDSDSQSPVSVVAHVDRHLDPIKCGSLRRAVSRRLAWAEFWLPHRRSAARGVSQAPSDPSR
jgi:hypothetical protein